MRTPSDGENASPGEARISAPGAAMLRIGASLDLATVLREAVEGARAPGLSPELSPATPVRGAPMRRRDARAGGCCPVGKERGAAFDGGDAPVWA